MKLGLVGMTGQAPAQGVSLDREREKKHEQIEDIFSAAADAEIDLLLFPGWTSWVPQKQEDHKKAIWKEIEWFRRHCVDNGIAAIFQVSHHSKLCDDALMVAVDPPDDVPHVFVNQLFSDHKNATKIAVDVLLHLIQPGQNRRISLCRGEIDVALVICGENNLLTNPEPDYDAIIRHHEDNTPKWKNYDLLFNPAHTVMGELHLLRRRWEWLSKGHPQRLCLYSTNARPETVKWRSHIYGFRGGEEIIADDDFKKGSLTLCDGDNPNDSSWVVVPIPVPFKVKK